MFDIAVGATGEDGPGSQYDHGSVYLFSGATRTLQRRLFGNQERATWGASVLITPDLNADGRDDLLVGQVGYSPEWEYATGSVSLLSGHNGLRLQRWFGPSRSSGFGSALAFLGDPNGDGNPDFLIGSSGILSHKTYGGRNGGFFGYSFDPLIHADTSEISAQTGGSLQLEMDFPDSEAGLPYRVMISTSGMGPTWISGGWIPLTSDGAFERSLHGQHPPMLTGGSGFLDANGDATAVFRMPAGLPSGLWNSTRWFSAATAHPIAGQVRKVTVPVALEIVP